MAEPNAANVFAGPVVLYQAPKGTAPPTLTTLPTATVWASAGYTALGYTEDGVEITTTPGVKPIVPDEAISPVLQVITDLKVEVKVKLLERAIEQLAVATAMSVLTNPGTGTKTLKVGSANPLTEYVLGFQGPAPGGQTSRVIMVWRGQVISAVSYKSQRKDVPPLDVTFSALTDSNQLPGQDVYLVTDYGAGS